MEEPKDRLKQARAAAGYESPTDAANKLKLNRNTLTSHENGNRPLSRKAAFQYADLFNVSAGWLLYGEEPMIMDLSVDAFLDSIGMLPGDDPEIIERVKKALAGYRPTTFPVRQVELKGYIGAGGEVEAYDGADLGTIDAPANSHPGTVAAQIKGLSMMPAFEDGTVIYWSKLLPPGELLNTRCVVQCVDDRIMVKTIRRGSIDGLYNLESVNPAYPVMEDVEVLWVAKIDWVKPR